MPITETTLINAKLAAEGIVTNGEIIRDLIINDTASKQKARMMEGQNYYLGQHDILKMNFRQMKVGNETINVEDRSNYHLVHKFHKKLVDQKKDYIAAKRIITRLKDTNNPEFLKLLNSTLRRKFNREVKKWIKEASNKGIGWLHPYYEKDGTFNYTIIPSQEIIPIYDTSYQNTLLQIIRYYPMYVVVGDRQVLRKRVEVWDDKVVSYWTEDEEGNYFLDVTMEVPTLPHWYTYNTQNAQERIANSWGKVPFIPLWNNDEGTTDLEEIKTLIDAYDLINSEFVNNLADIQEVIWTLIGYGGEDPAELAKKLRTYKILTMEDSEGKIEGKQLEIPVEARKEALRILEEKIYELGRGVKFTQDKLGNNPSGVSLKFLYNDLDSKAQDVITSLEAALEEFSWFVTDHIKRTQNQSFDYTQIEYVFTKSMISNEKEIIDNLNSSTDMMTREDRIAQHPYNTRDAKTILTEIKKDEEESMDSYSSLLDKQKQLGGEVDEE